MYREPYDALVLSTGSRCRPSTVAWRGFARDLRSAVNSGQPRIRAWISEENAKSAVIVGAGFIGLEMAENLVYRGLSVTVLEMLDQVLPPFDFEDGAASAGAFFLEKHGVKMALGNGVSGFHSDAGQIVVNSKSGARHVGDLVILAIGVRPETGLAKSAGLEIGKRGGIHVDEQMRTETIRTFGLQAMPLK